MTTEEQTSIVFRSYLIQFHNSYSMFPFRRNILIVQQATCDRIFCEREICLCYKACRRYGHLPWNTKQSLVRCMCACLHTAADAFCISKGSVSDDVAFRRLVSTMAIFMSRDVPNMPLAEWGRAIIAPCMAADTANCRDLRVI